eukprot:scaffold3971_cov159-Amphora_coffeaeformis.AAC.8
MVWTTLLYVFTSRKPDPPQPKHNWSTPSVRNSDLYDLVVDMDWERVASYAREHPITAQHQEGDSMETPLHAAVQMRPPVHVIRALLDAFPDAVSVPARKGEYPLHFACRYNASAQVLSELVEDQPNTARQETKWGNTPFVSLWRRNVSVEEREDYSSDFWQQMRVLLRAVAHSRKEEYGGTKDGDPHDKLYIVHAAVSMGSLGCPSEVLDFCLAEYPEQVHETDESGRLPLHLATGPTQWSCRSKRRYKPREQETLERLLQRHPQAARVVDPTTPGRLPLHSALAHRHEWEGGVCHLVKCAPDVLLQPDPVCGLLPFMAAATPVGDTVVDLNTIYHTLRFWPSALEMARQNCNTKHDERDNDMMTAKKNMNNTSVQASKHLWLCAFPVAAIAVGIAIVVYSG